MCLSQYVTNDLSFHQKEQKYIDAFKNFFLKFNYILTQYIFSMVLSKVTIRDKKGGNFDAIACGWNFKSTE